MTRPTAERLFAALDATWSPARYVDIGPWRLREGQGGGQRVSAATAEGPVTETDIDRAEDGMRALDQRPIFMIRADDKALDRQLEGRGYRIVDPVTLYIADTGTVARALPDAAATACWPPEDRLRGIWAAGGIGAARLAVMDRCEGAKTALSAPSGGMPAAVAFVAADGDIAMLHALEVLPAERRKGLGAEILGGAAQWALDQGAAWLTLAVTRANAAANGLYLKIGMEPAADYHYRRAPEEDG